MSGLFAPFGGLVDEVRRAATPYRDMAVEKIAALRGDAAVKIEADGDNLSIQVDIPGVKRRDLSVNVVETVGSPQKLVIVGARDDETFETEVTIPVAIVEEEATAVLSSGVFTFVAPIRTTPVVRSTSVSVQGKASA